MKMSRLMLIILLTLSAEVYSAKRAISGRPESKLSGTAEGMSEQQKAVTALHEHSDLGLCSGPDPLHRVEKRSYLPPISCTDEHELDAVRKKVHCTPRPRVVQLPWPNDTSVHQMTPGHVEVQRCDGGCFHRRQSCLPKRTKKVKIPVLLARCTLHSHKCDKICVEVEVEEHLECGCECKVKRRHCNNKQDYRKEICSCQCRDLSAVKSCYESGRVWDPSKCMCRCPLSTLQECSSKYVFDFTNSCKCIPEESNEIGKRMDRSLDTANGTASSSSSSPSSITSFLPANWELLVVGALAVAILFLAILTFSLARHVHRLKARLRRSAEVLVAHESPSSSSSSNGTANGTLINHAGVHQMRQQQRTIHRHHNHQNGSSATITPGVTTPMIPT